jgi:hypothetical protein
MSKIAKLQSYERLRRGLNPCEYCQNSFNLRDYSPAFNGIYQDWSLKYWAFECIMLLARSHG